jgi:hypothetical protein
VTDSLVEEAAHPQTEVKDPITGQQGPVDHRRTTSVAEDVMQKKGVYGRFADKWFSRKGWSADSRRTQGLSSEQDLAAKNVPKNVDSTGPQEEEGVSKSDDIPSAEEKTPDTVKPEDIPKALEGEKDATTIALLPRVLQTTKMYFSSGNFFYSYDYDLSHGVGSQPTNASIPLFKQYDPLVSIDMIRRRTTANMFLVLLEPTHYFAVHRCWSALFRSASNSRLRWTTSVHT